jgi:predicted nucleotidyltransferase
MTKNSILTILNNEKAFLRQKFHVNELGLFGSFVRGEERTDSDVDVILMILEKFLFLT